MFIQIYYVYIPPDLPKSQTIKNWKGLAKALEQFGFCRAWRFKRTSLLPQNWVSISCGQWLSLFYHGCHQQLYTYHWWSSLVSRMCYGHTQFLPCVIHRMIGSCTSISHPGVGVHMSNMIVLSVYYFLTFFTWLASCMAFPNCSLHFHYCVWWSASALSITNPTACKRIVLLLPDIMHAHRRLGFTSASWFLIFGCASEVGHVSISKCVLAVFFFQSHMHWRIMIFL